MGKKVEWDTEEDYFITEKFNQGLSINEILLGLDDKTLSSLRKRITYLNLERKPRQKDSLYKCGTCKEYKAKDMFNARKSDIYGIQRACKECQREATRISTLNKKIKDNIISEKTKQEATGLQAKTCTMCGEYKDINDFSWSKKYKSVVAICSKCNTKRTKEYEEKRLREKGY